MSNVVLVTGSSVRPELIEPIREAGYEVREEHGVLSSQELRATLCDVSGYLFGGDEEVTSASLAQANNLRVISFLGVGYAGFMDVNAVKEAGIAVTNTPGTLSKSVAELTVGLLIDSTRLVTWHAEQFREGSHNGQKCRELCSMRIGIVGLGFIGYEIAKILRHGFGCEVCYTARSRKPRGEAELSIGYKSLEDLAVWADSLIIMVAADESTRGLIDDSILRRLRPQAVLVNTSKPWVVDSGALLQGLMDGRIRTAAIDGFYDHDDTNRRALLELTHDRIIVTPHLGSLTYEARDRMGAAAVKNLVDYLLTGEAESVVVSGRR